MPYNRLNIKKNDYLIKDDIDYMNNHIQSYQQTLINWNAAIVGKLNAANSEFMDSGSLAKNIKTICNMATKKHEYLGIMKPHPLSLDGDDIGYLRYDPNFSEAVLYSGRNDEEECEMLIRVAVNLYGKRELVIQDDGALKGAFDMNMEPIKNMRLGPVTTIDLTNVEVEGEDITNAYVDLILQFNPDKLKKLTLVKTTANNPIVMINLIGMNCEMNGFVSLGCTAITLAESDVKFTNVNMYSYPEVQLINSTITVLDENDNEVYQDTQFEEADDSDTGVDTDIEFY